ncbi:uncharacterized protein M421DRAFT_1145 [Didymella exigua CBS 183.55]|uniref:Protein kinase domain-containing protein n=1 Tax=Didymella exigua CBS 183.55 TaxID=1150837 RepID=A0A6A5S2W1_9PLEO|nr:uncharacterized protein M421DRAFT_1145 [Didymella exigua CBS 183.55]KAF1933774.1 hypothetical protein M421DRAFT_1145 [Didymella exigua CBS 183.55]
MATSRTRPKIPPSVSSDDAVAIIPVNDPEFSTHLQDTTFRKTDIVRRWSTRTRRKTTIVGAQVFLLRAEDKFEYTFGRISAAGATTNMPDVRLPGSRVAKQQFKLVPDWEVNPWRIHSMSETVFIVNDVPLQKPTPRTRKFKDPFPHVLYLNQTGLNRVVVQDVQIDIWLTKNPREVITSEDYQPDLVEQPLQNVQHRLEDWAQSHYLPGSNQVSNNSFSVLQRFTGQQFVAKLFRDNAPRRDEEFLMFNRKQVDASIVQYLQSTEVASIPVIITSLHHGFASYASLRQSLMQRHPGSRFSVATKLLRRLYPALEFLHFHGIAHGNVSHNSVLMHLVNDKVEQVLLVDYSTAHSFSLGDAAPKDAMVADGKAVIQLIDDCSDLWTLRRVAPKDAQNENVLRQRTLEAVRKCKIVSRCCRDYFGRQGKLKASEKGKKLLRLLERMEIECNRAQDAQLYTSALREVGHVFKSTLDGMREEHTQAHGLPRLGEHNTWNLSLGRPYLDGLVTRLYHDRWDLTPREICAKIKELAGDIEDPWETFEVTTTFAFDQQDVPTGLDRDGRPASRNLLAFTKQPILLWLAVCCEIYTEWRLSIEMEVANSIRSPGMGVTRKELYGLQRALLRHSFLPPSMHQVFKYLLSSYDKPPADVYTVDVLHQVCYHTPSRMFNVTQLQRLSSPQNLRACITEGRVSSNHFAEVRGSPVLEGCYVSLALLPAFVEGLGVTVREMPSPSQDFPAFDPADFSQVLHKGRIVLARRGLLAYATMVRSGDQCCWHDLTKLGMDFETPGGFLPTYFGDAQILPPLPPGGFHARPEHCSGFATDEQDDDASVGRSDRRVVLEAKSPAVKAAAYRRYHRRSQSARHSAIDTPVQSALSALLRQREATRAEALAKRKVDAATPVTPPNRRERARTSQPSTIQDVEKLISRLQRPRRRGRVSPRAAALQPRRWCRALLPHAADAG